MNCNQCGDRIIGQPGATTEKVSGGWCGSRRVRRTFYVCQDCTGAGEYQQHLYRLQLQAELKADIEADRAAKILTQGSLF